MSDARDTMDEALDMTSTLGECDMSMTYIQDGHYVAVTVVKTKLEDEGEGK